MLTKMQFVCRERKAASRALRKRKAVLKVVSDKDTQTLFKFVR